MQLRDARDAGWRVPYAAVKPSTRLGFLKKVYGLFTASVVFSAAGALVALNAGLSASPTGIPPLVGFVANHWLISLGITLASVFGASLVRRKPVINVVALFGMATVLGVIFAPALFVAQVNAGLGGTLSSSPIRDAFLLSITAFSGLTGYALFSKKDFSYLGGALTMGLIVLFGASLINLFLGSSVFSLAISSVAVLLFGAYVLYDTSQLLRSDEDDAVGGAIRLYLDFINIFLAILRILSSRRE